MIRISLRIFHTADLHLGLKFHRLGDNIRPRLIEARFQTLQHMVRLAGEQNCDVFVIAGDLFHGRSPGNETIDRAGKILAEFEGKAVIVLPGNHDYCTPDQDQLWDRFESQAADNTIVLNKPADYPLTEFDLDLTVYAGPCTARTSHQNGVAWMKSATLSSVSEFRIGIAHGSLDGLSPDLKEAYFPMSSHELTGFGLDAWLLGHYHIRHPDVDAGDAARILFASTPEPDGFDCHHEGYAWVIDLPEPGRIRYRSLRTGSHRFLTLNRELRHTDELQKLRDEFASLDPERSLVKLTITGRLPRHLHETLDTLIDELRRNTLYMEVDRTGCGLEISEAEIDREFTEGSFPHAILKSLVEQGDSQAAQIAFELINEARR